MSKSLRLSEKWFRRGLWLVALLFAAFLIGLGGTIVGDLPQVETRKTVEDFVDQTKAAPLREELKTLQAEQAEIRSGLERLELQRQAAEQASQNARDTFSNWIATRQATQKPDQDAELIARTRALDEHAALVADLQKQVNARQQAVLEASQRHDGTAARLSELQEEAALRWEAEDRRSQLRVFLYRLGLTLPLLVVAGWLFARKRKSDYWPFVWGFIFFALFAFFVELVPYLPSYGGYVRYAVGIVITVLVGRQGIRALQQYLEKQKAAEQLPAEARRQELGYDLALARLAKGVCPGCERNVDLKDGTLDFCPHCGISLFDHCTACERRKNAFARFCQGCGTAAQAGNEART